MPIEMRNISDLVILPYGDNIGGRSIDCEPRREDIDDAILAGRLETRNYQMDIEALKNEWISECRNSPDPLVTWKRLVTGYHAGRIAHFVVNGWEIPISINANNAVTDGTHRIKAAIFMGWVEVQVTV